jgi:hypothetical protein
MYAPGTRRHIKAALDLGATPQEIMEVLKLCVVQGVQACNLCLTKSSASERSTSDKQLDRSGTSLRQFPPSRLVCLTEETVETLYILDEQDLIVGVSGYAVRPRQVRREKPRVSAFTSEHALPKGEMTHRGAPVDLASIRRVGLLTVEGENDDISGIGQTLAAQELCRGIPPSMKANYLQNKVGHFGVFNGSATARAGT